MKKFLLALSAIILMTACSSQAEIERRGSDSASGSDTTTAETTSFPALSDWDSLKLFGVGEPTSVRTAQLIKAETDENGRFITDDTYTGDNTESKQFEINIDKSEWEEDLSVIKEYFFGTWKFDDGNTLVIDDSGKDFGQYAGESYPNGLSDVTVWRIGDTVLADYQMDGVQCILWIDINNPEVLYSGFGNISEDKCIIRDEVVIILTKTDS